MRPELETLVELAGDASEWERQQAALTELSMFLEMTNRPQAVLLDPDFYRGEVSSALRSEPLADGEQKELVTALRAHICSARSEKRRIGVIGALTMAAPWLSIEPLLDLLVHRRDGLTSEEVRLVLIGLERALDVVDLPQEEQEEHSASHIFLVLGLIDPRSVVETLAAAEDDRVSQPAQRLSGQIEQARQIFKVEPY